MEDKFKFRVSYVRTWKKTREKISICCILQLLGSEEKMMTVSECRSPIAFVDGKG